MTVVIPGNYDPITLGHIELVTRAISKFDVVHCVVPEKSSKSVLFNVQERLDLIKLSLKDSGLLSDKIVINSFDGLTVDYCIKHDVSIIIRGIRGDKDLALEDVMSYTNSKLDDSHSIDTFVLLSKSRFTSSSMVKELAGLGVDKKRLEQFVTKSVADRLVEKF